MKLSYGAVVQDARGRFGGTVHSAWRATRVLRRFRAPSNPNTTLQQEVRRIFINCTRSYLAFGTRVRAAWLAFAVGKNFTDRNHYIAVQVPRLKGKANLNDYEGTPGDPYAPMCSISSVTPGAGQLTVNCIAPTAPPGYTLTCIAAEAIRDQDWGNVIDGLAHYEAEDATPPYAIVITGLIAMLHQVRAFCVWVAPDGKTRYSLSAKSTGTPT